MTRKRRLLLGSLQSRFVAVYMIVMAPIAMLASYYQYTILAERFAAREIAALDALEGATAGVTSTFVQTDLLLDVLTELNSGGVVEGEQCIHVIDAIVNARFQVAAAGIYTRKGQPICTQGMLRSGMVTDTGAVQPQGSTRLMMTDSDLLVTKVIGEQIIAIEADLPKVELPDVATDYAIVSRRSEIAPASDAAVFHQLGNRFAPAVRGVLKDASKNDIAVLPQSAFETRLFATLKPGIAAPPNWVTAVNSSFVPLILLALSLLLADLLIRRMALNDITRLTREMRAFRESRELPKAALSPWATEETEAMLAEFSTLADQLLHEEAEAQNRLHNATILQREIFHRVGNNLQIIQSILRLYARNASNPTETQIVERISARIRVINLVHNALHRTVDAPMLPAGLSVRKLIQGMRGDGMIPKDMQIDENYEDIELRVNRVYALCYLMVEKLVRLSRSGAKHISIDLQKDGDKALLTIKTDVSELAPADPVSARLRQVYISELRATAHWSDVDGMAVYTAVMPRRARQVSTKSTP